MKKKRILVITLVMVLVCAVSIAGTFAYLTSRTEKVENTFTVGSLFIPVDPDDPDDPTDDSGIHLLENEPAKQDDGSYVLVDGNWVVSAAYNEVIPGATLPKNPTVFINGLKANAYLFVEVVDTTESITATVDASNWTKLDGVTGKNGGEVYYAAMLNGSNEGASYELTVLANDQVVVATDVTEGDDLGSLSFYGYICQAEGFNDAAAAWTACFAG